MVSDDCNVEERVSRRTKRKEGRENVENSGFKGAQNNNPLFFASFFLFYTFLICCLLFFLKS